MICHCEGACSCAAIDSFQPIYHKLLSRLKPARVFEWGPGTSTNMALDAGAAVLAIEPSPEWAELIVPHDRLRLVVADTSSDNYLSLHGWDDADLFFIDCRRRAECLDLVRTAAKPTAVVCLHDAQRSRYQEAIRRYKMFCKPTDYFCVLSMANKLVRSFCPCMI